MFESYLWRKKNIGFAKTEGDHFIFFGNRSLGFEQLREVFPKFKFLKLKQVHSADVIEATESLEVADAHYSQHALDAVVVQTADCLPILLSGTNVVAACHAGWRGLAAGILPLTIKAMGSVDRVFFGPHIGPSSFEVGRDVATEILKSVHMAPDNAPKCFVDLLAVAKAQIHQIGDLKPQIESLDLDTKTNLAFHSFRRDGPKAERQYSFIVRLR